MKTTLHEDLAHRFDRFSSDVNLLYQKYRKQIPSLKKTKLKNEKLFAEVFVFWYIDENKNKLYIKS
jgi:hypothetical protein